VPDTRIVQKTVPVSGIITNASTGKPMAGVSVRYKNLYASITDSAGEFTLKVPNYNVSILVEGGGFQSKEIALKGRNRVSAGLYEDTYVSFYDMAVLPFGQTSKNQSPSAVTSVQTQGAWDRSFETPDSYLQGKVAGLNVIRRSGTPNVGADLFLRGFNSLYGSNQPLIVVDGIIYDNNDYGNSLISNHHTNPLAYIDVKDIDNISVIKDGSSTYGTKGANGVIMITTARAKELGTKIDFSVYGGINLAPKKMPLLNATEYRTYLSQVLQTSGLTEAQIQSSPYMNDDKANPDYYRYHYNTDWQKQVLDKSSVQNYYMKVTGGDNIARYALSVGFMKNAGVIKTTDIKRYNTRFNADMNLSKKLTAISNLSFTFNEQTLKDQGIAPKTNPLFLGLIKAPILSVNEVSDNGTESPDIADRDTFNTTNPVAIINDMQGLSKNYRFSGSLGFNYSFSKSLTLGTIVGLTIDKVRETMFVPSKGVVEDTLMNAIVFNRSGSQAKRLFMLFNDTRLSYDKTFNRIHSLKANLGFRFIQNETEQDYGFGFNSATDELVTVGNGISTLRRIGGDMGKYRWMNTYLNADYNLSGKYFLSFNMAMDGSSRFGKEVEKGALTMGGNSYAVLPSLAGAWLASSENFMAHSTVFQLLKLRASISLTGNDDIGNYTARQFYTSQNFLGIQGLVRGNFGNPGLQWEKVRKLNAGLDLSLLNERFNFTVDVYNNTTSKMIIYEQMPSATGLVFASTNSGGMKTSGVDVNINTRVINQSSLKWDIGLNIAHYKSNITRLPAGSILTNFGGATMITGVDADPNLFYGYQTNGVYSTDAEALQAANVIKNTNGTVVAFKGGDVRFIDQNGDHVIDDKDRMVIGNPNPDFTGAVTSRLEWNRWSMDALFTFSKGNDIYNYVRNQLESVSGYMNQTPAVINSWKNNGDITSIPKATWGDPVGNSRFSDRWIEDGSYFRLRSLSVSYNIPVKADFLKYSVLYLTGNNLFTLTNYLGYDPEFSATSGVLGQGIDIALEPQFKSVQLGIRVGL
jgi:TonB-linked SusC/RagA family outer membrane protein